MFGNKPFSYNNNNNSINYNANNITRNDSNTSNSLLMDDNDNHYQHEDEEPDSHMQVHNDPYQDDEVSFRESLKVFHHFMREQWRSMKTFVHDSGVWFLLVLVATAIMSLLSGTPNAQEVVSSLIQRDFGIGNTVMALFKTAAMVGMFFSLPGGICIDKLGELVTACASAILSILGYLIVSFTTKNTFWLTIIGILIVSFGSGGLFMSVLSIALKYSRVSKGRHAAWVSTAMSASGMVTVAIARLYLLASDCSQHSCWRGVVRTLLVCKAGVLIPGLLCIGLFKGRLYLKLKRQSKYRDNGTNDNHDGENNDIQTPQDGGEDEGQNFIEMQHSPFSRQTFDDVIHHSTNIQQENDNSEYSSDVQLQEDEHIHSSSAPYVSMNESQNQSITTNPKSRIIESISPNTSILKDTFFWILLFAYFSGISSGMFVIVNTGSIWTLHIANDDEFYDSSSISSSLSSSSSSASLYYGYGFLSNIDSLISATVFLFSAFNALGTLTSGIASDYFKEHRKSSPLSRVRVLSRFMRFSGHLLLLLGFFTVFPHRGQVTKFLCLFMFSSLGFLYGACLSLVPVILNELYPREYFGRYFGYIQFGSTAAALIIPLLSTALCLGTGNHGLMLFILAAFVLISAGLLLYHDIILKQKEENTGSISGDDSRIATNYDYLKKLNYWKTITKDFIMIMLNVEPDTGDSSMTKTRSPNVRRSNYDRPILKKLDSFFGITRVGSSFTAEILGGITSFLASVILLPRHLDLLNNNDTHSSDLWTSICLVSAIFTTFLGFTTNLPVLLSASLASSIYTSSFLVNNLGFSWEIAQGINFVSGVTVLAIVYFFSGGILSSFPQSFRTGLGVGIGIEIAFLGATTMGLIEGDDHSVLKIGRLSYHMAVGILGIIIIIALHARKFKISFIASFFITTILSIIILAFTQREKIQLESYSVGTMASTIFTLDFSFESVSVLYVVPCIVVQQILDAIGSGITLIMQAYLSQLGVEANIDRIAASMNKSTKVRRIMFISGMATVCSTLLGGAGFTPLIESSAGIVVGAKTCLASFVAASLFIVAIFIRPLIQVLPPEPRGPILLVSCIMPLSFLKHLRYSDTAYAIPAIFTAIIISFSLNIATGAAFGYCIMLISLILSGGIKRTKPSMYIVGILMLTQILSNLAFILDF